jgi:hypothetical protein
VVRAVLGSPVASATEHHYDSSLGAALMRDLDTRMRAVLCCRPARLDPGRTGVGHDRPVDGREQC